MIKIAIGKKVASFALVGIAVLGSVGTALAGDYGVYSGEDYGNYGGYNYGKYGGYGDMMYSASNNAYYGSGYGSGYYASSGSYSYNKDSHNNVWYQDGKWMFRDNNNNMYWYDYGKTQWQRYGVNDYDYNKDYSGHNQYGGQYQGYQHKNYNHPFVRTSTDSKHVRDDWRMRYYRMRYGFMPDNVNVRNIEFVDRNNANNRLVIDSNDVGAAFINRVVVRVDPDTLRDLRSQINQGNLDNAILFIDTGSNQVGLYNNSRYQWQGAYSDFQM